MTSPRLSTHPPAELLARFALGHLDDEEAVLIADHLGDCEACQQAVGAVENDSLVASLRPAWGTPVPNPGLLGATAADGWTPPELLRHERYHLLVRLGAGGMGVVYKAEHRLMGRAVALKVINKQLTASPAAVERFRREVRAVARLSHPNLVQAHDAEQVGDLHFLVMELIDGVTLSSLVENEGPLAVGRACEYVRQAAAGLGHAFERGLVHRDVKPHNLMVTPQGQVKVLDFGLASIGAERGGPGGLTGLGQGMGTPDFVAPEQLRDAHSADTRADIYSLGYTLYFLLTARPPFPEGDAAQKMVAHLERQPPPAQQLRPDLPRALVQVLDKMTAKDPGRRYQTPAEVVAALEPFCGPPAAKPPPRRWRWAAVAGLLLVVAGAAAALLRVETEYGTLEVTTEDPEVQVLVKQRGKVVRIIDPKARRTVELKAGAYELELSDNGRPLELSSNRFTLTRDGKRIAVVKRLTAAAPAEKTAQPGERPPGKAPDLSKLGPIIDEDFSNRDDCHFATRKDEAGGREVRVENGRYLIRRFKPGTTSRPNIGECIHWSPTRPAEGDFACQVKGRVLSGPDHGWALVLFNKAKDRHVAIRLRRDGRVEVGNIFWDKEDCLTRVGPIHNSVIRPGDEFNTLLVVCRGGRTLEVYVNGSAVAGPIQLEKPLGLAYQGLVFWQRSHGVAVAGGAEFSRFTLWRLPKP